MTIEGKLILVTGATSGIGKVTACELARLGAETIVVGRNPEKTRSVVEEIKNQTRNPNVSGMTADLSSQADIRKLAEQFKSKYSRLDVLVNNAGAFIMSRQLSVDGYEMTFALNHLSYFLLTNLLLDALYASPSARVVNVSSAAHMGGHIHFDDLQLDRAYAGWGAYSQSKLANVLFTYELSRKISGSHVTVNALHPGFVATNFGKNNGGLLRPAFGLVRLAGAISPDKGAETSIYLASAPEVEGVTGKYFDKKEAVFSSDESYDVDIARHLWQVSAQMTGLQDSTSG